MRSLLCVSLLVALASPATASYDLMMLPDANSGGIVRYDPVSRVRLGTFALGSPTALRSVNLSNTAGTAWVTGPGTMRYNYGTGAPISSLNFPDGTTVSNIAGTRFTEAFTNTAFSFDANMSQVANFTPTMSEMYTAAPLGTDRMMMVGINAGNLVLAVRNNTNGALVTRTLAASGVFNPTTVGSLTILSDNGSTAVTTLTYFDGATLTVETITVNLSTLVSTSTTLGRGGFSNTAPVGVMRGHTGYFIVGRDSTTPTISRVVGVNGVGNIYTAYTTSDFLTSTTRAWVGANVVAPEPGSLGMLVLGAALLLRRRRTA